MLLILFTLVVMGVVAYAALHEGALTAFLALCNVFLAGLVAFDLWEPLANALEPMFSAPALAGTEDAFCLALLFCGTLALLRFVTNRLAPAEPEQSAQVRQGAAGLFGLAAGYLTAGFLVCVFQTLPIASDFAGFEPRVNPSSPSHSIRRLLPPDRVWLALMHRAGAVPLARPGRPTFDEDGSFTPTYTRLRRYKD